jgi:adenylate cyclase
MTWRTRLMLHESAFTAAAFTFAVYLYYLIAFWGIQDHFTEGPLRDYLNSRAVHLELFLSGILIGGMIGVINRIIEIPRLRSKSVGQVVLFQTVLYLVSISIVFSVIFLVYMILIFTPEVMTSLFQAVTPRYLWSFIIYLVFVIGAINFALEVERVVGPGNLWRLLVGSYRRPQEEKRVFLFMDLKGSTTIAEKLGHLRYSELLQECYRDLTKVIIRYEAAIYQYVGDEVVMSWLCKGRVDRKRTSVLAFFAYKSALMLKRETYKMRFGLIPEFRGSIDVGEVTVIEVGDVKREIAYHGDVLNTAARLLELCKTRGEELVVSRTVGESVEMDTEIRERWHEEVSLRGKPKRIEAYSLQPAVKTP